MLQPGLFSPPTWTVSDLTRYIRQLLEGDEVLQEVWVRGEISNFKRATSGHIYFSLKDPNSTLQCVIWRSTAVRIHIPLDTGMAVEVHGTIGVYERDGSYQLYVSSVRVAGEGALFQEFLRLKASLEAEGLFDEERKRPVPARPQRIGVVTSPTGAALQDILNTLRGRYPFCEVILAPSAVQGSEAPFQIVASLERLQAIIPAPDVILLARGGGSLEDLWAFNDERVVRAVAACRVPVICGVGHETDFTLTDFTADLRAPTPTGAAVMATPDRSDLLNELYNLQVRLRIETESAIQDHRGELTHVLYTLKSQSPLRKVMDDHQQLDIILDRSALAYAHAVQIRRAHWQGEQQRLLNLNPLAVLKRGFALVTKMDGTLVHSALEVQFGEQIRIQLADGSLKAKVEDTSSPKPA